MTITPYFVMWFRTTIFVNKDKFIGGDSNIIEGRDGFREIFNTSCGYRKEKRIF